jgi:hypothetical protein
MEFMKFMDRVLVAAILVISTAPLYAQRQQQNVAKLKVDARNLSASLVAIRIRRRSIAKLTI